MRRISQLLFATVLLAACFNNALGDEVQGSWLLVSGDHDGEPILILDSHPITMTLDGENIGGTAACNSYGGRYQVSSNGGFQIPDGVAMTEMACIPAEAMESESQYAAALVAVTRIERTDDGLRLTGGGYTLDYITDTDAPPLGADNTTVDPDTPVSDFPWFPPETYGDWVLVEGTADGKAVPMVETHPITLSLSPEGFGGQVCNRYGFSPPLPEDGSFPPIASTLMACQPPEVMDSEAVYLGALQRLESVTVVEGQLVIIGDGVELIYDPS